MNPVLDSPPLRSAALITLATLLLAAAAPVAAQGLVEYGIVPLPLPAGFHASAARGIADRGWEPLTVVGTVANSPCKASCWIRVSQQWTAHELPGLDPGDESWANAVSHVPGGDGEYTAVVGAAMSSQGTTYPMRWDNVSHMPWMMHALMTLNGGGGEARAIFHPDGVPVRTLACGWADEVPPVAAADGPTATATLRVPVIWETTAAGERVLRPEFGVGLEALANDIGSIGVNGFLAVGGGFDATSGAWWPQVWTSVDDGETWSNTPLPLPLSAVDGEAVDFDYDTDGVIRVAGWGRSTGDMMFPLMWELDTTFPAPQWIIHELPLQTGQEGGETCSVRKRPGRTTYSGIATQNGAAELAIWTNDTGMWVMHEPAGYLVDPQAGTPISPGGTDAAARIAATVLLPQPVGSGLAAPAAMDTMACLLVPTSLTAVEEPTRPRRFISVSASPNPFNPRVRIAYALPHDDRVVVSIHDATGARVARFDEEWVRADEERSVSWDGTRDGGDRVASGVYFVRVTTRLETATVKIVLIK